MIGSNRDNPDGAQAQELLSDLARDRARLAPRMRFPSWLLPALGAVSAAFVAEPAIPSDEVRQFSLPLGLLVVVILVWRARREMGVQPGPLHISSRALQLLWLLVLLTMLSTSFGLVSLELQWWVLIPVAVTFVTTIGIGRRIGTIERNRVVDVH